MRSQTTFLQSNYWKCGVNSYDRKEAHDAANEPRRFGEPTLGSHCLQQAVGLPISPATSVTGAGQPGHGGTVLRSAAQRTFSTEWDVGDEALNVLSIAGMGRSGSTLLASLLGLIPGFIPVGELSAVWQAAELDVLCSCGASFSQCPFWTAVGEAAFGGWARVDSQHLARVNRSAILRHRRTPFHLSPQRREHERRLRESYTTAISNVYRAVKQVTGASVIVDSTQDGPYVLAMRSAPNVRLRVVHLVRDSRGVAFSWRKVVECPEFVGVRGYEGTVSGGVAPAKSGAEWLIRNLLIHFIEASGTPCLLMRYESLIAKPVTEIQRVLDFGGQSTASAEVAGMTDSDYEAKMFHTVGGNRIRFLRGRVPFRLDNAWRTQLSSRDRLLVSMMTLPLLMKYGYVGPFNRRFKDMGRSE
jgi:hypothetical protein